jgi:hypothetical protein
MTVQTMRVGDIAKLARRTVVVDSPETYQEIIFIPFRRSILHKTLISGAMRGQRRVFEIHPGDLVLSNVFAWEGRNTGRLEQCQHRRRSPQHLANRREMDARCSGNHVRPRACPRQAPTAHEKSTSSPEMMRTGVLAAAAESEDQPPGAVHNSAFDAISAGPAE